MTKQNILFHISSTPKYVFKKTSICLLSQSGLQIDKLLNENGVIFCSVKKQI